MQFTHVERSVRSERKARGFGHLRRAELLEAAQRIFTTEGYEGATIRRIADEVGVSSTALYMYFQDKSEIMLEICVGAMAERQRVFDALFAERTEPVARLRGLMEALLGFGFEQPTAYQLLYGVVPRDLNERRNALTSPYNSRCFARIQDTVQEAIVSGRFRPDLSPRQVAEALVAACHGAVSLRVANPFAPWVEPEVLTRTLLESLFRGFQAD